MSRRLRLLFVPREVYPTDRVRINVLFGSELLGRGHEIDLIMQAANEQVTRGPQPWFGRTLWVGGTDDGDSFLGRVRKHWRGLVFDLRMLWTHARKDRYDILLVSDKILLGAVAVVLARLRGLKFVFWLTFPYPEIDLSRAQAGTARYRLLAQVRGRLAGWAAYRWIMPRADHVFVQSDRMKTEIAKHGVDARKMSPIVTGFGLREIPRESTPPAASADGGVTLVYLGTLSVDRHLGVLIDMLGDLRRSGVAAKLLLVGYPYRQSDQTLLERHAEAQGVAQHVEITGFLPQAEALRRTAGAHIGLSPIYRSAIYDVGSPTKLIEYMALGLPVVANDHPEQRLILRESQAGVCVPWAGKHFARAVRWLLSRSAAERAAMGARGREWVEANRTYATIADDVERRCLGLVTQAGHPVATNLADQ